MRSEPPDCDTCFVDANILDYHFVETPPLSEPCLQSIFAAPSQFLSHSRIVGIVRPSVTKRIAPRTPIESQRPVRGEDPASVLSAQAAVIRHSWSVSSRVSRIGSGQETHKRIRRHQ
jgi:hypothetical protein